MKKLKQIQVKSRYSQKGVGSLLISIVILTLVTFVTIYTSKTVLLEQKIAANDFRSRQAFEAAEAGIGQAIAILNEDTDHNKDELLDGNGDCPATGTCTNFLFDSDSDGTLDSNTYTVGTSGTKAELSTQDLFGENTVIRITSTGYSDDATAQRTIIRDISVASPLPNTPDNPFTTRGNVTFTGSATVFNQEGASTIWSGGDVDLGSNNSTATEVANVTAANYPACMETSETCTTIQTSNKTTMGLDIVEQDANLANLSADQFFENTFGKTPAQFKSEIELETPDNIIDAASVDEAAAINNAASEIFWIDGPANLGGVTVGCESSVSGTNISSADCPTGELKPSIIIVNGDLEFSGNAVFYGLIFVTGSINVSGSPNIIGAIISAGNITNSAGGGVVVRYNSTVLKQTRDTKDRASSAGSWRDFS